MPRVWRIPHSNYQNFDSGIYWESVRNYRLPFLVVIPVLWIPFREMVDFTELDANKKSVSLKGFLYID